MSNLQLVIRGKSMNIRRPSTEFTAIARRIDAGGTAPEILKLAREALTPLVDSAESDVSTWDESELCSSIWATVQEMKRTAPRSLAGLVQVMSKIFREEIPAERQHETAVDFAKARDEASGNPASTASQTPAASCRLGDTGIGADLNFASVLRAPPSTASRMPAARRAATGPFDVGGADVPRSAEPASAADPDTAAEAYISGKGM